MAARSPHRFATELTPAQGQSTEAGKKSGALYRQRMDFLLLAPDRSRIVIEVDGVPHYGRPNSPDGVTYAAVPRLYAEMVAESISRTWGLRLTA